MNFFKKKKIKSPTNLKKCLKIDGKCLNCHSTQGMAPHHIIHRSLGGDDSLNNLICLCFPCHRKEHDGKLDMITVLLLLKYDKKIKWRWKNSLEELKKCQK